MSGCGSAGSSVVPRPLPGACVLAATRDLTTDSDGHGSRVSMEAHCDAASALLRGLLG